VTSGDRLPVIVVGAGLAGLTCARLLAQANTPVVVLEAADAIGGRVRTDVTLEGFVLDRGFQVLFTAYPALRRVLDLRTLDLRLFDNGAAVVTAGGPVFLRDPMRHPGHALAALTSRLLTWLEQLGVQLVFTSPALSVDAGGVQVPRGRVGADLVVWTTGVRGLDDERAA